MFSIYKKVDQLSIDFSMAFIDFYYGLRSLRFVSVTQNNYLPKPKDLLTTEKSGYFATPCH